MSVINLFLSARNALAARSRRRHAYAELAALDDRSLADIGIHRSQIPAIVARAECVADRKASANEAARDRAGFIARHGLAR